MFDIKGRQTKVASVALAGEGQQLRINVLLEGEVPGSGEIWAEVAFSPESQSFRLRELEFVFDSPERSLENLSDLFYEPIREVLQSTANERLDLTMQSWRHRLTPAIDQAVPDNLELDLSSLYLRSARVHIDQGGLRLTGYASGEARFRIR